MDGIQSYSAASYPRGQVDPRPIVATVHAPHAASGGAASGGKQASDYLRAVRRRIWLVFLVAIPIASGGTLLVLRMPAIYSVAAQITIEAPKSDPAIRSLVGSGEMIVTDSGGSEKYVPSTLALLSSRSFLAEVLLDPALGLPPSAFEDKDPATEMVDKVKTRIIPQSSIVRVTYEGKDPELITRILDRTLTKFVEKTDRRSRYASEEAKDKAQDALRALSDELNKLDLDLATLVREYKDFGPNGQNLKEAEYEMLKQRLGFEHSQVTTTQERIQFESLKPPQASPTEAARAQAIAALREKRQGPARRLNKYMRDSRDQADPGIVRARAEVQEIDQSIARLERASEPAGTTNEDAAQQILNQAVDRANATQEQSKVLMEEMRGAMPVYQKYTTMTSDRELKAKQIASLREKLSAFKIVTNAQKKPVEIIDPPNVPVVPIRPNRTLYIAVCLAFSLGIGLGLVCLLEHVDHSVKVPEHLTAGLALPLFGVVPRMIRSSGNHRGGHLWTSGTPDSIEADAYRNLRASLLGATDDKGPMVTLLITSAKAGEGKSTTALNLAATCARAGERTLLMDVDLRRPSLNGVFPGQDHDHGLVDVLRGDLPWQRTVVQTDLPNLDFLPTGDTRDVPIEVLGSLELRQLLLSLSQNHYDRVILDGPAVLGLADCRMLGRIVDAAVMVVRSGSQEIRSLQRAKAMLEQSQVFIAGLIFNGLCEDLENWSSYGPNPMLDAPPSIGQIGPSRGLDGRGSSPKAKPNANAGALMGRTAAVEV